MKNKINKILIANRSEIASRINSTCKKMGIKTISIFSEEDKFLPFVYQSAQNHLLSKKACNAYMNVDEILQIAKKTNCDAIHPGYGFWSEQYKIAQKVIDQGLIWIGPSPQVIKLLGNKIQSSSFVKQLEIPCIPGIKVKKNNIDKAKKVAKQIGYPILLKDPLGGGGKAITKIHNETQLDSVFESAQIEAYKMTGSSELLLEKYIENGKHIEIQIAGDGKNFIHFFERECSLQRRHQKIIEEAPCNFITEQTLNKLYDSAIKIAQNIKYTNIGTVEFLVTPDENFYFLEVNPRIQVEHSVTELITGIDLVQLQIQLAQNNKLPYKQEEDIKKNNHAIECRIYAEDPKNNFLPSCGKITNLNLPNNPYLRLDHNLEKNFEVTSSFDPMICKATCWGQTRNDAIANIKNVLSELIISGITTNINFLKNILKTHEFIKGLVHTQILNNEEYKKKLISLNSKNIIPEGITPEDIALIANHFFKLNNSNRHKIKNKNHWRQQQWS